MSEVQILTLSCQDRPGITAPIASATSVAQLRELLGGIELRLDAEATAALDTASAWREA